jgi:hypothetical protein
VINALMPPVVQLFHFVLTVVTFFAMLAQDTTKRGEKLSTTNFNLLVAPK